MKREFISEPDEQQYAIGRTRKQPKQMVVSLSEDEAIALIASLSNELNAIRRGWGRVPANLLREGGESGKEGDVVMWTISINCI